MTTSSSSRKEIIERDFSVRDVFQFTTSVDVVYMTVGGIGAIITGLSIPTFNILFGEILDELNDDGSNLQEGVNKVAMIFAIFAAGNLFTGMAQVCLTISSLNAYRFCK